jgi:hypothetical protein
MRPTNDDYEILQSMLAAELGAELDGEPFDPGIKQAATKAKPWQPQHSPTQQLIFRDVSEVVGACAEKGTGKSIGFADKIIAHCYTEWDALYVIIGNSHRALAEGICHDLITFSLPRWKDGNREPLFNEDEKGNLIENPRAGELMDAGIGLEYTGWKCDPNNKDLYLKIRNRFGGWSRIRVIAIPYGDMVQARVTNLNASGFYLEEATRCDTIAYYEYPAMQLNRRRGIKGPQQFCFSCNQDDPAHWVYIWMYKTVVVGKSDAGRDWPDDPEKPGIRRDIEVAFYYLPFKENRRNIPKKYRETLAKTLRSNPTLKARLMDGKWIAMPVGDALFKGHFQEGVHIKGDVEKKKGIEPVPGYPIVIGMDWGARSVGIVFKQIIESEDGPFDITLGSISYYQEMHKTRELARAILEHMRYWNDWLKREKEWDEETAKRDENGHLTESPPSWSWWFITGDDATTNYNPDSGNIHARDLQDHMTEILEEESERYIGIELPVIRGCPRPKDSVGKRVDIMAEGMMSEMVVVSAMCEDVKGMLFNLPRDKDNPSHPAKGNRWIHIFDAWSYPNYYRRFVLAYGFYNVYDGSAIEVS